MFTTFINKALSLFSFDSTNVEWLKIFNEQTLIETNDYRVKQLIRTREIPSELRRTVWPKLIKLHKKGDLDSGSGLKPRRHSRSLSIILNESYLEIFQLSPTEISTVKGLLMGYHGEVHLIMQVIIPLLIKYCELEEVEDLVSRINNQGRLNQQNGYFFYPNNIKEILIFERSFEELLKKFAPLIMKRIANIQQVIPDFAPEWDKLLFGFFIDTYPLSLISHIFDCFLVEGYKILLRFSLAHCIIRQNSLIKATGPGSFSHELFKPKENCTNEYKMKFFGIAFDLNFSRSQVERYRNRHRKTSLGDIDKEDIRLLINQTQKMPTLLQESIICGDEHWKLLWKWIPTRIRLLQVDLVFRTSAHGGSLGVLYDKCSSLEPLLLLVETREANNKFGVFISKALTNRPIKRKYSSPFFGSGETFIFKLTEPSTVHFYNSSDVNSNTNFICAEQYFIAFGCSEGKFGIWLGENLTRVSSAPCKTFGGGFDLPECDVKEIEIFKFV